MIDIIVLLLWLQMMDGTPGDERSASTMSQASSPVEPRGECTKVNYRSATVQSNTVNYRSNTVQSNTVNCRSHTVQSNTVNYRSAHGSVKHS